jgi:quinol monooxygenase YgiN
MTIRKLSLVAATLGLCALGIALQGAAAAGPQQANKAPAASSQAASSQAASSPAASSPAASSKDEVFVVTHVDIVPDSVVAGAALLRQYALESRRDPGVVRFELLQQGDRPNHFTIVSVWENQKAFDAHLAAAHTKSMRAKLQPLLGSPFDERLHRLAA